MRGLLLAGLLLWVQGAQASVTWDSLWRNADQRGEEFLQQGDATAAAHTYHDPQRKAYAELKAGEYQQAARDFSAYHDGDSDYNRGNALARAGRLQEAIKAYDAALASNPGNRDARRNRKLVEQALKKQPPQSSSDKKSSAGGKNGSKNSSGGKNSKGKDGPGQHSSAANRGGKAKGGKAKPNMNGQQQSDGGKKAGLQNHGASDSLAGNGNMQPRTDDAAQTKRDAMDALGKPPEKNTGAGSDAPMSEQQLAQQQWLRRIPDDPGGLLRRKFMIEHMLRQQRGQP